MATPTRRGTASPGDTPSPIAVWLRIPPPLLFAAPLVLGIIVAQRWPLLHAGTLWMQALHVLGVALIVIGASHALSSAAFFALRHTTIVPHHRSVSLVTSGANRWTRNPMYLGLLLVYLGVSGLFVAVWPLLLLPLPLLAINAGIIPMEERLLEDAFGTEYLEYKARVRRWL